MQFDNKISYGTIITLVSLFVSCLWIYFGVVADVNHMKRDLPVYIARIDANNEKINNDFEAIKTAINDMRASQAGLQSSQLALGQQINLMQQDTRNLLNILLREKTSTSAPKANYTPVRYEVSQ